MPTYNYLCNQSKKTGPCGHVYVISICFGFFLPPPPPCQPKPPPPFSSVPFKGWFKFPIFIFQKERKKGKEKMYRIVSCRVANARVGYRIKCFVEGMMKEKKIMIIKKGGAYSRIQSCRGLDDAVAQKKKKKNIAHEKEGHPQGCFPFPSSSSSSSSTRREKRVPKDEIIIIIISPFH